MGEQRDGTVGAKEDDGSTLEKFPGKEALITM